MSDTELDSLRFQVRDLTARLDESRRTVLDLNRQVHEAVTERVTWHTRWETTDKALGEALAALKVLSAAHGEPVAVAYDFDGYGWRYIDAGSGSDWLERGKSHPGHMVLYSLWCVSGPENGLDGSGAPDVG